jgi:hypothetical protein
MAGIRAFPDEEALFSRARALGADLCHCIAENRAFPQQAVFHAGFKARMLGLVDFMQDQWKFEHEQWEMKRRLA